MGRTPLVRSIICEGMTNDPGAISSRKDPTAEKAMIARTPKDLRAAILALEGMFEGEMVWPGPWRAKNAMRAPEGRAAIVTGLDA